MIHKIDWISFTFQSDKVASVPNWQLMQAIIDELPDHIEKPETWTNAPYREGYELGCNIDNSTFVFADHNGRMLIEHTGQGCRELEERGRLMDVITVWYPRLTRLDIATDILAPTRPLDFVKRRGEGKTTSEAHRLTRDGETWYLGSQQSDRFVKVYRYDKKHPRKEWLRIEYTYRAQQAKLVGKMLLDRSIEEIAVLSGKRYKWKHPVWKREKSPVDGEIKAWRPERGNNTTANWIYSQCVPAIVRLIKAGDLNYDELKARIEKEISAEAARPNERQT